MNKDMFPIDQKSAWVVFSGQTDLPWLRIFKSGFRHCYVVMNDGTQWITVDPLSSMMDVRVHALPPHFDLPLWLKDRGLKVVKAPIDHQKKQAPWMVFTCVEAVKRILGIHKRGIITPWQLYKHLTHQSLMKTFKGDLSWAV